MLLPILRGGGCNKEKKKKKKKKSEHTQETPSPPLQEGRVGVRGCTDREKRCTVHR